MAHYPIQLSVLDVGSIRTHQTAPQAFEAMLALAQVAQAAGCTRYWVAEHHNAPSLVAYNTPLITSALAAATRTMKVGGYVLLPHYPPLLLAEQLSTLEALYPHRINACVGCTAGTDGVSAYLLRGGRPGAAPGDAYAAEVRELLALLQPEGVQFQVKGPDGQAQPFSVKAMPGVASEPEVWVLGASIGSAQLAAQLGLPYSFPYHVTGDGVKEALKTYRKEFVPNEKHLQPKLNMSVIAIVAPTTEEAERLAKGKSIGLAAFRSGEVKSAQMLTEEVDDMPIPLKYAPMVTNFRKTWIVGTPPAAAAKIQALANDLQVEEILINPSATAYRSDDPNKSPTREYTVVSLAQALGIEAPG